MQSHSLIQVGRDLRRPPQSSTNYCSTPGWSQLHPAKAWVLSGREDTPPMDNLFQSLTTCMGKTFPLSPVSISSHATCAQFFSLQHFWSPLRRVCLCSHSAPLRKRSVHQDSTHPSHLQDEETAPQPLLCALTSLMALHGLLPIGEPLSWPGIYSLAQGLHRLSEPSGGEGLLPWTCWVQLCQHSQEWLATLAARTQRWPCAACCTAAPRAFWAEVPFSRHILQPWAFSDGRQQLCDDTRQLPQRPPVCPVWSHRAAYLNRP